MYFKPSTVLAVMALFLPAFVTAWTLADLAMDMNGCPCALDCIKQESDKIKCPDIKCTCESVNKLTKPVETCIKNKCKKQLACGRQLPCKYCHKNCKGFKSTVPPPPPPPPYLAPPPPHRTPPPPHWAPPPPPYLSPPKLEREDDDYDYDGLGFEELGDEVLPTSQ